MADPIKLGIIGAGLAVRQLHWPALKQLKDKFTVVALADVDTDRARETAKLVGGGDRIFADYHELLALDDVEAVLLALPIHLTTPIALDSARAGKHVLMEKPLGSNLEQGRQLMEQLAELPVTTLVAENFRYRDDLRIARELIGAGRIGDPLMLRIHSVSRANTDNPDTFSGTPWRHDNQYRGGPILDAGVHHAAALRILGGDVEWVQAFAKSGGSRLGGPTTITMNLRFRSGALGSYVFSVVGHDDGSAPGGITVYGTDGTITIREGKVQLARPDEKTETIAGERIDGGYYGEFANFYAAVRAGEPVVATLEQSYRDMELILRGLDSAEQAQVILL
jgi:predicted dehydrogenase